MNYKISYLFLLLLLSCSCFRPTIDEKLPILGPYEKVQDNKQYHPVRDFVLFNQVGDTITRKVLKGKIRVADFFFTSCPTICPILQNEMLKIHEHFRDKPAVVLLSHTVDPRRDSIEHLARYARNLGIEDASGWHFLTGDRDEIYTLADDYFNIAVEDASAPGGFDHSGRITVVDTAGYIRSFCNGLDSKAVDLLINDIEKLLQE